MCRVFHAFHDDTGPFKTRDAGKRLKHDDLAGLGINRCDKTAVNLDAIRFDCLHRGHGCMARPEIIKLYPDAKRP